MPAVSAPASSAARRSSRRFDRCQSSQEREHRVAALVSPRTKPSLCNACAACSAARRWERASSGASPAGCTPSFTASGPSGGCSSTPASAASVAPAPLATPPAASAPPSPAAAALEPPAASREASSASRLSSNSRVCVCAGRRTPMRPASAWSNKASASGFSGNCSMASMARMYSGASTGIRQSSRTALAISRTTSGSPTSRKWPMTA
mmetsp:Transcript_111371/g.295958  ORF Transcript_111371/g.295958 Transcript_111371/m.295958 type:complete len:208 (-) Transcript_111371:412-1035(-)